VTTRAVDRLLEFANLHAETCGGLISVQLRFDGTTFHAWCPCGAAVAVAMSAEDERAAQKLADSYPAFVKAMRRAHRRIVQ
jgi:hypothetical protein